MFRYLGLNKFNVAAIKNKRVYKVKIKFVKYSILSKKC